MKYTITLLLLFSIASVQGQLDQPGTRIFHFYDENNILLDSNNKHTKQYNVYVSYTDYDGNKISRKKQNLSKTGEWGGTFDRLPMTFFIQVIKQRDTMNVTIRHIFARLFSLDGIRFLKGNYEADFYSERDTIIHSVHVDNWWSYRTDKSLANPLSLLMEGVVVDKDSDDPLGLATIAIPNSRWARAADVDGRFKIDLSRYIHKTSDSVVLKFYLVGYIPLQLVVHPKMLPVLQRYQLRIPMEKWSDPSHGFIQYGLRKVAGYKNRYELERHMPVVD
jgi:hypothetical protein